MSLIKYLGFSRNSFHFSHSLEMNILMCLNFGTWTSWSQGKTLDFHSEGSDFIPHWALCLQILARTNWNFHLYQSWNLGSLKNTSPPPMLNARPPLPTTIHVSPHHGRRYVNLPYGFPLCQKCILCLCLCWQRPEWMNLEAPEIQAMFHKCCWNLIGQISNYQTQHSDLKGDKCGTA